MDFYDSNLFSYVVLPLLIFMSRIVDVSIGTLRIVFISRGKKYLAPLFGFFEVLIWIIVVGKVMQDATNFACYIGYAGGFAMGNFVGMLIEEKLAMGIVVVRIITSHDSFELKNALIAEGFGVTTVEANGSKGKVDMIFTTVERQDLPIVDAKIKAYNPSAFYSVEDVKFVKKGVFPTHKDHVRKKGLSSIFNWRVGK
ncbi:MAG: hypothetical protein CVU05_11565 [Bacteroidetes bacterium HGW-Bacteroidetes-21]|jgi:uncharacterized protein YebE (UPF0316 family)|nr:MAG: hypothetical protein CVU05_11565 [Bacteroidetes bacterium HGW-Bacteroidetes-21]